MQNHSKAKTKLLDHKQHKFKPQNFVVIIKVLLERRAFLEVRCRNSENKSNLLETILTDHEHFKLEVNIFVLATKFLLEHRAFISKV